MCLAVPPDVHGVCRWGVVGASSEGF
jgi:hypothetical protein